LISFKVAHTETMQVWNSWIWIFWPWHVLGQQLFIALYPCALSKQGTVVTPQGTTRQAYSPQHNLFTCIYAI
jgi:hypothetical protein